MTDADAAIFIAVCREKNVDTRIMFNPKRYKEQADVGRRKGVLRELRARGWTMAMLGEICPLTDRAIHLSLKRQDTK